HPETTTYQLSPTTLSSSPEGTKMRAMLSRWVAITIGAGLLLVPAVASAADLIVPAGQSSTRSGEHVYETVQITGTLNVKAYDGTPESGWLYLRANRIVIDAEGV